MTIGGYGFSEQSFIDTLRKANIDTLVDIRQRRGMRGAKYAFLNSKRLQSLLAFADINYLYIAELAPTTAVRDAQKREDQIGGISKSERTQLSLAFTIKYQTEILDNLEPSSILQSLNDANSIALFCVEARPAACHRILAAERLKNILGSDEPVGHLRP